jgi:L-threonylcarbamoyladenylate synthase
MYITLDEAISFLNAHDIVALPTETVYGLAARADDEVAINKIFTTKLRPLSQPLILHVASIEMAKKYVNEWTEVHQNLAEKFWPGPLTILTTKSSLVSDLVTANSPKVAIRFPRHELFVKMIDKLNCPLVAPSANPHQRTSPTKASHVEELFDKKVPVVDGGPCSIGVESSIIEIFATSPTIKLMMARPGHIKASDIESVFTQKISWLKQSKKSATAAPGQQAIHYRPNYTLVTTNNLNNDELGKFLKNKKPDYFEINENAQTVGHKLYDFLITYQMPSECNLLVLIIPQLNPVNEQWNTIIDRLSKASDGSFYTNFV